MVHVALSLGTCALARVSPANVYLVSPCISVLMRQCPDCAQSHEEFPRIFYKKLLPLTGNWAFHCHIQLSGPTEDR